MVDRKFEIRKIFDVFDLIQNEIEIEFTKAIRWNLKRNITAAEICGRRLKNRSQQMIGRRKARRCKGRRKEGSKTEVLDTECSTNYSGRDKWKIRVSSRERKT